jgi:hypothetical protein
VLSVSPKTDDTIITDLRSTGSAPADWCTPPNA